MQKKKRLPVPLKPANIPGQNPATPERMPGHTQFYDPPSGHRVDGRSDDRESNPEDDQGDELDEALERTFPASDPVSRESPLISRRPKSG